MALIIRPLRDSDIEDVLQLSLLAWEPVFESFVDLLGPTIYALRYPDWRKEQREGIEKVCRDSQKFTVLVADVDGVVAGFIAYTLIDEAKTGEVEYLAVHPAYQNRGIGTELNKVVLVKLRESGMQLATVGTGGDPSHAPARRSYEKAGYRPIPIVRYIQDL